MGIDPSELLRQRGLRVTVQRLAVLRAVSNAPHVTADVVAQTVRGEIGSVSVQAVYDALAALTQKGLLRRIQPAGSPARYEARVGDNHHHLICRGCERMVDVDCAVGAAPCLTALEDFGYEIDEAEIVYWGRCPECVAATAAASDHPIRANRARQQRSGRDRERQREREPGDPEPDTHGDAAAHEPGLVAESA